jgi:hypothetical protein
MKSTPIVFLLLVMSWMFPALAHGADERELTTNSVIYLMRSAMRISREGREIALLKALRQLQDPTLAPFFEELARNPHPVLKVHGILGLAECTPDKKLDLLRIASIEQPSLQAQVVSAAMDSNLLSADQANQLINWPGLDIGVRVLVATQQIAQGNFEKPQILEEAAQSDNLARRSFAILLQVRLGQPGALAKLDAIHNSDDPIRDRVREMLLRSAMRYNMDMVGPWAMHIATEPGVGSSLGLLGLKAAMRFKIPEAQAVWQQQYNSTSDLAQKTRLALLVARESPALAPSLFDTLIADENELIQKIGQAGKAIASHQNISENVINLVGMDNPHPLATSWALIYAQTQASAEDATAILLSLVLSYENASPRSRMQLLENAISAAQTLINQYPAKALALLKPILENANTDPMLQQGIVLAMIRSDAQQSLELANQISTMSDPTSRQLLLMLKAKHGVPLTRNQLHELALMVRGGGVDDDSLRVQAGWSYIKQTQQVASAMTKILNQ